MRIQLVGWHVCLLPDRLLSVTGDCNQLIIVINVVINISHFSALCVSVPEYLKGKVVN